MMNELKEYLKEGGAKEVFTRYAVEIGDLCGALFTVHIEKAYPMSELLLFCLSH